MRYSKLSLLIPCALLLSACTTVTPAYKDNGPRIGAWKAARQRGSTILRLPYSTPQQ